MKTRKLGNIEVSEIGMGCMGFSHGYGQIPDHDYSIEAIRKAYDYGCRFFDTAEAYGNVLYEAGHNEKIVGEALEPYRKDVVIATKLHYRDEKPADLDDLYAITKRHLLASLMNLRTDYVDLYYLHRVSREIPVEDVAKVMGRLCQEGLIRGWGLSQVDLATLKRANEAYPVSAVQNLYNMLERDVEEDIIPYCLENNIGLVPFSPIASGFLSGKIDTKTDFSHADDVRKFVPQLSKENMEGNMPVIELINQYASNKQCTNAQIALSWMLKKYPNVVPIPGSKNQGRILENLKASEVELSDEEFKALDDALCAMEIHGHRGNVEYDGMKISDWGKVKNI